jgi:enoyl-CoA hydratase/carnithine racemase
MSDELAVEDRGRVRWLVVDRHHRRNAWTFAMGEQLAAVLEETADDPAIGALVVFGRGGSFSSGIDRADLATGVRQSPMPVERYLRYPKPTVACVDGLAFGMGFTLAVGSDLRVVSTRSTFTLGFGGIGMVPEWGASFLLWRQVGWSRALDLALTNRTIDAAEAYRIGLADRVVEPEAVEAQAQEVAEQMASLPPGTAEATKALLWGALEQVTLYGSRSLELRIIYERRMQMVAEGWTPARPQDRPGASEDGGPA